MRDTEEHSAQPLAMASVRSLAQRTKGEAWRLDLLHANPEHHSIFWVTRGQAKANVDGTSYILASHNAVFVPAGALFSFSFPTTSFGQSVEIPAFSASGFPEDAPVLRVREPALQLEITGLIDAMAREARDNATHAGLASTAYAQLLCVSAIRMIEQQKKSSRNPPARVTASTRLIRAYCALLAQDFSHGTNMAGYAQKLGVTPTHLSRVCKAKCGISAADMLLQRILHAAASLLSDSTMPINLIAEELGFSSPAYFTRFVQHHTSKSPTDLRKTAWQR